jgi:hypothetical protein
VADAGGASTHHARVEFANAPPGMRSGLVNASGDATFSLRTKYAMADSW